MRFDIEKIRSLSLQSGHLLSNLRDDIQQGISDLELTAYQEDKVNSMLSDIEISLEYLEKFVDSIGTLREINEVARDVEESNVEE